MNTRKRESDREQLDDTQIRTDTQVRGSLGKRPSGLTDEQWCEQEGCDDARKDEDVQGRSDLDDDDRMSER